MSYNPEVGMPVDEANDWFLPELIGVVWTAGFVQDSLTALGFTPTSSDPGMSEPCPSCNGAECADCNETGIVPLQLRRSKRWVNAGAALRVPNDRGTIVSPYLAACVAAAMRTEQP